MIYTLPIETDKGTLELKFKNFSLFKEYAFNQLFVSADNDDELLSKIKYNYQSRFNYELTLGVYNLSKSINVLNIGSGMGILDIIAAWYLNNDSRFYLLDKSLLERIDVQWGEKDHGFYNNWYIFFDILSNTESLGLQFAKKFKFIKPGDKFPNSLDVIKSNYSYMYHYPKEVYWNQILPHAKNGCTLLFDILNRSDTDYELEITKEIGRQPISTTYLPWIPSHPYVNQMVNINNTRGKQCLWI